MSTTKTPHINILDDSVGFGKTVLMPGDPLRSKFIAENFLDNPILVNNVRGVQGYTGTYKGVKVSVMASGMGMPSIGIYSYELFKHFGVQNIVRIGSAGAISKNIDLKDIVIAMSACTNSSFIDQYGYRGTIAPTANYDLLNIAKNRADSLNINASVGTVLSSDTFYDDTQEAITFNKIGCLCVEMEAAALYTTAMRFGMRALAILSISDLVYPPFNALSADDREKSFTQMMTLALDSSVEFEKLPLLNPKE